MTTPNTESADMDAVFDDAKRQAEEREAAHARWINGEILIGDDLVRAYRYADNHNSNKRRKDPAIPAPEIHDIVQGYHRLICTPSERESEWYEWSTKTKCYDAVASITVLIVGVLDKLGIPTQKTNALVGNIKTRLRGRCTIRNLQRAPCVIDLKKREAHTFRELNALRPDKKPLGYPVACKTTWYLVTEDGESEEKEYGQSYFLLNRLDADPKEGVPEYTANWVAERLGEDQAIAFWEWASYCLTPFNTAKKFHVWYGDTDTGKSTGVSLLELILGSANVGAQAAINLDYTRHRFATSALRGRLLNVSEEDPGYGNAFEKCIKSITGGSSVSWEVKNGPSGEERPTYRLLFTTNEAPKIVDNSDAYANRIIALHWNKPIRGKKATIEEITRRFSKELPQVLWKCLRRRRKLARDGFHEPEISAKLLREILFRSTEVGPWFQECVSYAPDSFVSNAEMYESYTTWCARNGEKVASNNNFGKRLRRLPGFKEESFQEKRTKTERGYTGIRLVAEEPVSILPSVGAARPRPATTSPSIQDDGLP